jgi:hypothetical protein
MPLVAWSLLNLSLKVPVLWLYLQALYLHRLLEHQEIQPGHAPCRQDGRTSPALLVLVVLSPTQLLVSPMEYSLISLAQLAVSPMEYTLTSLAQLAVSPMEYSLTILAQMAVSAAEYTITRRTQLAV